MALVCRPVLHSIVVLRTRSRRRQRQPHLGEPDRRLRRWRRTRLRHPPTNVSYLIPSRCANAAIVSPLVPYSAISCSRLSAGITRLPLALCRSPKSTSSSVIVPITTLYRLLHLLHRRSPTGRLRRSLLFAVHAQALAVKPLHLEGNGLTPANRQGRRTARRPVFPFLQTASSDAARLGQSVPEPPRRFTDFGMPR